MPQKPRTKKIGTTYVSKLGYRLLDVSFENRLGRPITMYTFRVREANNSLARRNFNLIHEQDARDLHAHWKNTPKELDLRNVSSAADLRGVFAKTGLSLLTGTAAHSERPHFILRVEAISPVNGVKQKLTLWYIRSENGIHKLDYIEGIGGGLQYDVSHDELVTKALRSAPKDVKGLLGQIRYRWNRRFGKNKE